MSWRRYYKGVKLTNLVAIAILEKRIKLRPVPLEFSAFVEDFSERLLDFHDPRTDFDARLVVGAAIFGIGWGLGGFCPGPALTSLPLAASGTLFFAPAMLVGMVIAKYTAAPSQKNLEV